MRREIGRRGKRRSVGKEIRGEGKLETITANKVSKARRQTLEGGRGNSKNLWQTLHPHKGA